MKGGLGEGVFKHEQQHFMYVYRNRLSWDSGAAAAGGNGEPSAL